MLMPPLEELLEEEAPDELPEPLEELPEELLEELPEELPDELDAAAGEFDELPPQAASDNSEASSVSDARQRKFTADMTNPDRETDFYGITAARQKLPSAASNARQVPERKVRGGEL